MKRRDIEKIKTIIHRSKGIPKFIRRISSWQILREYERSVLTQELERIEQLMLGLDLSIQMEMNEDEVPFMAFELIFSLDYACQVIETIVRCFDFREFQYPEDDEGEEWKRGYQDG